MPSRSSSSNRTRTPARFTPRFCGQMPDPQDPPDVVLRVQTDVGAGAGRADQTLTLVDAQRARMNADELSGDADHVDRTRRIHALRGGGFAKGFCHVAYATSLTIPLSRVLSGGVPVRECLGGSCPPVAVSSCCLGGPELGHGAGSLGTAFERVAELGRSAGTLQRTASGAGIASSHMEIVIGGTRLGAEPRPASSQRSGRRQDSSGGVLDRGLPRNEATGDAATDFGASVATIVLIIPSKRTQRSLRCSAHRFRICARAPSECATASALTVRTAHRVDLAPTSQLLARGELRGAGQDVATLDRGRLYRDFLRGPSTRRVPRTPPSTSDRVPGHRRALILAATVPRPARGT